MATKQAQTPDIRGGIAFGSGLAATLLLLAAFQGSVPAMMLAYLSPLPLMIATIGFGHVTGLGAVLAAFITLVALLVAANPQDLSPSVSSMRASKAWFSSFAKRCRRGGWRGSRPFRRVRRSCPFSLRRRPAAKTARRPRGSVL